MYVKDSKPHYIRDTITNRANHPDGAIYSTAEAKYISVKNAGAPASAGTTAGGTGNTTGTSGTNEYTPGAFSVSTDKTVSI